MKASRTCKHCLAIVPSGRCPCRSVKPRYKKAKQGSLEAAHFYHLIKSIRTGSWARGGHITASHQVSEGRWLCDNFGANRLDKNYSVRRTGRRAYTNFKEIQFFVFRCEIAAQYWRDEFAGLMGRRMNLWLGGCDQRKAADYLQLPFEKLRFLDKIIRGEFGIRFPWRQWRQHSDFLKTYRRMKAGVAGDILRRREHRYKQYQVMAAQQDSPFS